MKMALYILKLVFFLNFVTKPIKLRIGRSVTCS